MTTMGKYHLKSCLTFACAPIPCEKKSCGIGCQLITPTILMLSRKGNMILKVDRQGFVMVPKIVKKWWLSWSYLELKKAQIPRGTNSCAISYQLITPTSLMPSRKGNMILKVDRQGFLTVPISGQKVMIKMGQCHLKHGLTFARAPCTAWNIAALIK